MKALVYDGRLSLTTLPDPEPGPDEALVKVLMAGICNTDVEITRGYMSFHGIPGHEFVGVVARSPIPEQVGLRVVGEINAGCGQCAFCRKGLERHCPNRTVLGIVGRDGAFAEYLTLPAANLVAVPDAISDEKAVFTEPLAAALEILEQVSVEPAHRVLLIGDGKLGLLICMVLRLVGCDLVVAGKHASKLERFEALGAAVSTPQGVSARRKQFDIVVEASGHPSGWGLAVEQVKPRGTLVLKSTYHGALDFNPAILVIDEITVVGSRCGRFAPALRLMERGLIDPTQLISGVFPFDEADKAFEWSQEPGVLKVLLKF